MPNPRFIFNYISTKAYALIGAIVAGLTILLHFFILYVVFPKAGGTLDLYVPAKTGGKTFLVNPDEFLVASYVAIGLSVIGTIAVMLLLRAKKMQLATTVMVGVVVLAMIYIATYGGNAIHEMWGDGWTAAGLIAIFILWFALELPLISSMSAVARKRS